MLNTINNDCTWSNFFYIDFGDKITKKMIDNTNI